MADDENPITVPFSLRLTFEERAELEKAAAGMPLGAYIRSKVLNGTEQKRRTRGKFPVKDYQALGQVLAALGKSRVANNLNQLAKAVHTGSLPVTPETEEEIKSACRDVRRMRTDLLTALGRSPE